MICSPILLSVKSPLIPLNLSMFGVGYSLGTGVIMAVFHMSGHWPFFIAVLIITVNGSVS